MMEDEPTYLEPGLALTIGLPEYICPVHGEIGNDTLHMSFTAAGDYMTMRVCTRCLFELAKRLLPEVTEKV